MPTSAAAHGSPAPVLRVWSLPVRLAHWTLAGAVISCLVLHEGGPWHERLGYAALAVALWRLALGFVARTPQLRFGVFVKGLPATLAYARSLRAGAERRHLGHNPLGGWMILALLACAATAAASGALYATDAFWGDDRVYIVHRIAGWALAGLVPLHVLGALLASRRHRENLVRAMITGDKPAASPGDIGLDGR